MAGLYAARAKFKETVSTFNTDIASTNTSLAFSVARLALSINGEMVCWAISDTYSVHSKSICSCTSGAVLGVSFAGGAGYVTVSALVHGSLVKTLSAVESTDTSDHHVGTLIIAGAVEKNPVVWAASAGSVGAKAGGTSVSAVLASAVNSVGANRTAC